MQSKYKLLRAYINLNQNKRPLGTTKSSCDQPASLQKGWDRSERREILRSKISLTSLMGHMPAGAFGAGWLARCLRQSEFDVSQILTVLGGGCP